MVQGVPDDNKNQSDTTKDQSTIIETIEEVTQPADPILDETNTQSVKQPADPVIASETDRQPSAEAVKQPTDSVTENQTEPQPLAEEAKTANIEPAVKAPSPKPVSGTLYLLSYLLWEREGVATYEITRAQMLDTIALLIEHLRTNADGVGQLKHVILGGQTVLIEDIAAVRSDLLALLVIYNAGGRFGIGPWYIQVDSRLVSGESLIRNLLLGRMDVSRHGIELMDTAFMPFAIEHSAQLPQILAGFDISSVLITSPEAVLSLPFRWVAPDGSHVMVINHHNSGNISKSIEEQEYSQPDGPFLWLNPIDDDRALAAPTVGDDVQVPTIQSTLGDYMSALHKGLPDGLRPALKGELQLLGPGYQAGRFSTRLYLKQANARLQSLLTHQTEPWLAIALTDGKPKSPDNLRALLDHSWRELMKNQSRNNLTGCSHDTVTQETEIRNQRILDVTQRIQDVSLDALPGTLTRTTSYQQQASSRVETYIGIWNSHNFKIEQIVDISLVLPKGMYPKTLLDDKGADINFSLEIDETDSEYACQIGFRAQVDAVGYTVYTVQLSDQKLDSYHDSTTSNGKAIGNAAGEALRVEKGELVWSRLGQRIADFLSFHDGGDAGDTYNYRKPQPDVVVRAGMTDMVSVESTATYERLIFRKRMRIAPDLKDDLSRTRGLSLLDITTTATFYDNIPGIYFRTTFTNKAQDHRLRAHLRTNIKADSILTDGTFGLAKRKMVNDGAKVAAHPQVNIFPLQTVAAIEGERETLVLMSRGLTEIEPIVERDGVTLALTLLRSVGWLKRGENGIPVKGAQYERDIVAEYAILPMKNANPAAMLRAGQAYTAPLQAFQYHEKPDPIRKSYLTFDNDSVVMTALKPPQTGKGWIVRFLNPTDQEIRGTLTTHAPLLSAKLVNLAEEDKAEYVITKNTINVTIEPNKIHTIRLEFRG